MADNRLWLIYKPTGVGLLIGKRLGEGWYCKGDDMSDALQEFYAHALDDYPESGDQDAFVLWRQDQPGWKYTTETVGLYCRKLIRC